MHLVARCLSAPASGGPATGLCQPDPPKQEDGEGSPTTIVTAARVVLVSHAVSGHRYTAQVTLAPAMSDGHSLATADA